MIHHSKELREPYQQSRKLNSSVKSIKVKVQKRGTMNALFQAAFLYLIDMHTGTFVKYLTLGFFMYQASAATAPQAT